VAEVQEAPPARKAKVEKKEIDAELDKSEFARSSEDDSDKTIPLENGPVDSSESPDPAEKLEEVSGKLEGSRPVVDRNPLKSSEEEPQNLEKGLQASDEGPQTPSRGPEKPDGPEKCDEDGPRESKEKTQISEDDDAVQQVEVEEFYVKYKNL